MSKVRTLALSGMITIAVLAVGLFVTTLPAYAWHATVSGTSECVDGQAVIHWSVQNSEANSTMHVTASDNAAVPVGTDVAGGATGHYDQLVDNAGDYSLDIAVSWSGSDETSNPAAVIVNVPDGCTPPTPTPTPTPTPPVPTPPAPTPPGPTPPPTPAPPVPDTGA